MNSTIVIVDDSLTVRMDLIDAFSEVGLRAIGCDTLAAARAVLLERQAALLILDVLLPDGSGIDLAREIRSGEAGADLPILMLSTGAEVRDRLRGLGTGSNDYVGKPYDRDYVVARARELMDHGRNPESTRVLVIDDSATFREELCDALASGGYAVLSAASGEEGLRTAAAHRPHAIIVDSQLPGIDGATVVRRVRLDAALRNIPCVLLTGSSVDMSAELSALDAGADAFVRKEEELDVILARIAAALRAAGTRAGRHAASLLGPKRILAVDDSMTYLDELTRILRGEGYDVIPARSGEEALEMLSVQPVDCILLDLFMPGLSGTDTCERIKASPVTRDVPLVMLTAHENRESMIESLGAGADDYVLKSSADEVLKARVRAQLRRKQIEDENRHVRLQLMRQELETAEARAAKELAETRAALVDELQHKNAELVAAKLAADAASKAKGTFLATMSHEIRTPMNGVLGLLELLSLTKLDAEQRGTLEMARQSGRSLIRIIDDILDLSKIEAGKLTVRTEVASVADIVQRVYNLYSGAASSKGLILKWAVDPEISPALRVDPLRLQQILNNFMSNAIKFTAAGSVELRATLADRAHGEDLVRIGVKDTGIGISAANQEKVFQAFNQAEGDTAHRFGGTGLGLAICRRLADMMGGSIAVESVPGQGTTIVLTMPMSIADPAELPSTGSTDARAATRATLERRRPAPTVEEARAQGTLVLVVDDHIVNRLVLSHQVGVAGYAVEQAESGVDAWRKWERGGFGLIVTDCHMPEMDGFELTRAVREAERAAGLKRVPIIACTANALEGEAGKCLAAGMDDYLAKPIEARELIAKLDRWLPLPRPAPAHAARGT